MDKKSIVSVVVGYMEIDNLRKEQRRRRRDVAQLVADGRISAEDMADLIGVTTSAVTQLVGRLRSGAYNNIDQ
jgi:predicted transcriptional regulator